MWFAGLKILISASVIAFASWLSGKRPDLAGFIIALPLSTLLVLAFSYVEYQDPQKSAQFARSIFVAVPLTLSFFLPFLFADKLQWPFWGLYGSGLACLVISYFLHHSLVKLLN